MTWLDVIIFAVLFVSILLGFVDGPLCQLLKISGLCISFLTAFFYYDEVSNVFTRIFSMPVHFLVTYFIIFALVVIITYIIASVPGHLLDNVKMGGWYDLLGAVLGLVKGILFCGAIIFGVLTFCDKPVCNLVYASKIATKIGVGMESITSLSSKFQLNGNKGSSLQEEEKPVAPVALAL